MEIEESGENEVYQFMPYGIEKLIKSWKQYPFDQWLREQELGRIRQSLFKIPELDIGIDELTGKICGGKWIKILDNNSNGTGGWFYVCDKCKCRIPVSNHIVYHRNNDFIGLLI